MVNFNKLIDTKKPSKNKSLEDEDYKKKYLKEKKENSGIFGKILSAMFD